MLRGYVAAAFLLIAAFQPSDVRSQTTRWVEIHAKDDAEWSRRSGLAINEVQHLRKLAGISDESPDLIANIDTSLLRTYNTVVFATHGGSAKCVSFWVFSREGADFKQQWSTADAGDEAVLCADPKCSIPVVKAQPNRDITVEIPSFRRNRCAVRSLGLFQWNGSGYTYKGVVPKSRAKRAKCAQTSTK